MSRNREAKLARTHQSVAAAEAPSVTSVRQLYERFCRKLKDTSVVDPLGQRIFFRIESFPYLIKLEYHDEKLGQWVGARAKAVIHALQERSFDPSKYRFDETRAKALFRIPEILVAPDSIHENIHPRVAGKLVYVKRLGRSGGPIKVVLTTHNPAGEWTLVTSFYTQENWLRQSAKEPPLYEKPKGPPSQAAP